MIRGHARTSSKCMYRTKLCTVCISSRIKENVTSAKKSHFYSRHILQTTEALNSGTKFRYMFLPVGQAKGLLWQVTHW